MFSPDQLVVYPAQGVGRVERIERQEIGGVGMELYIVRILSNNITLMVPVATAKNVGLRPLSDPKKAEMVLASLQDRSTFSGHIGQNWNRRYREYSEKLKSGDLDDVCHVLKELILISGEKDLSFGERRLQEQAMALVTIELACILDKEPEAIKTHIESFFADILQKESATSE
ncbi:MAG: RNA polymerase-binding transcription factor CarD [Desulfovibrio sp.]